MTYWHSVERYTDQNFDRITVRPKKLNRLFDRMVGHKVPLWPNCDVGKKFRPIFWPMCRSQVLSLTDCDRSVTIRDYFLLLTAYSVKTKKIWWKFRSISVLLELVTIFCNRSQIRSQFVASYLSVAIFGHKWIKFGLELFQYNTKILSFFRNVNEFVPSSSYYLQSSSPRGRVHLFKRSQHSN